MYDVAGLSRLSIATISEVPNLFEQVTLETRGRVLTAYEELAMYPKQGSTRKINEYVWR
ncbi:MAG: LacI family DNA-binding transcriptional regulator [Candidatus Promineifilaceae bacterium]